MAITKHSFSNVLELQTAMLPLVRDAEQETMDIMLKKLQQIVADEIYGGKVTRVGIGIEDGAYERTGEFYDSFETTKVYTKNRGGGKQQVYGGIAPSKGFDTIDQEHWVHKSNDPYTTAKTMTTYGLAQILNDGLPQEHSVFGELKATHFWDEFKKWASANYGTIFNSCCAKRGIKLGKGIQSGGVSNQYVGDSLTIKNL